MQYGCIRSIGDLGPGFNPFNQHLHILGFGSDQSLKQFASGVRAELRLADGFYELHPAPEDEAIAELLPPKAEVAPEVEQFSSSLLEEGPQLEGFEAQDFEESEQLEQVLQGKSCP
uniref:Uncharacterized protein n=1 Tax=Setaria viridis TaxID=4556 RepID=A0A4V6DEG2_SETVI|nr:hypothetical protein SEVIR_2G236150v2 [Setaria viridis]